MKSSSIGFVVGVADTRSRLSNAASATTRSRRPKMGMERPEEPQVATMGLSSKRWKVLATLGHGPGVFLRCLVAHLPRPVHLIAEAPLLTRQGSSQP